MKNSPSIGEYLIERLYGHGVRPVFGIPGDYVLGFYDLLSKSKLKIINTCDEQGAGFAADAYARVRGLGIDFAQGYAIHRPEPYTDLAARMDYAVQARCSPSRGSAAS